MAFISRKRVVWLGLLILIPFLYQNCGVDSKPLNSIGNPSNQTPLRAGGEPYSGIQKTVTYVKLDSDGNTVSRCYDGSLSDIIKVTFYADRQYDSESIHLVKQDCETKAIIIPNSEIKWYDDQSCFVYNEDIYCVFNDPAPGEI